MKIMRTAGAVEQRDVFRITTVEQVEDHAFRTRQAGTARDENQRLFGRAPDEEAAERAGEGQGVASLQIVVKPASARAARNAPNVQFDLAGFGRSEGDTSEIQS